MLSQTQMQKLQKSGLSTAQINQVVRAAGGAQQPKSAMGFVSNLGSSAAKLVGDTASGVAGLFSTDPEKNTLMNLGRLGAGAVQKLDFTDKLGTGYEKYANSVGNQLYDRYGTMENIGNTLYNDPFGAAADVAGVVGGGAGLLARGAKAGQMAGLASKAGRVANIANKFDLIDLGGSVAGRAAGAVDNLRTGFGKSLVNESDNILTRGMGNPRQLEKARGVSPVPMDELFKKYDLYDRTPEAFGDAAKSANEMGRSMLEKAPQLDTRRVVNMFDQEIAKLEGSAKTSTKAKLAMDELINRKKMFLEGIQKNQATPLYPGAQQVYDIKSDFQGDLAPSTFGMPTADIGKNLGVKKAYQTLLSGIEEQAPGIKNVGREQSSLLELRDIAQSSESKGAARQNLNFSKMGSAGVGGLLAGVPGAVAGFVGEKIANSPKFLGGASKGMSVAGKALQRGMPALPTQVAAPLQAAKRTFTALRKPARALQAYKPAEEKKPKTIKPNVAKAPTMKMPSSSAAFGKTQKVTRGNFY